MMPLRDRLDPALDKDLPLREDICFLGRLFGDNLREHEGDEAFSLVEYIRQTAVRFRRDGDLRARDALETTLKGLSTDATTSVIRAFTYFSQLSNIAEALHRNRRRRALSRRQYGREDQMGHPAHNQWDRRRVG